MDDMSMTYGVSASLTANAFTAPVGYHFAGWATVKGGAVAYADAASVTNLTTVDGGTVTLYAVWTEDANVTINYVPADATMGSTSPGSESLPPATGAASGSKATANAGYHFVSWTDAGGAVVSTSDTFVPAKVGGLNVAATYTANFAPNAYAIKFDANGGTGSIKDEAMIYGESAALTANAFTRDGYTFAGWNTKADGSGTSYTDLQQVLNLITENDGTVTLYAQWTPNPTPTPTPAGGSTDTTTESAATGVFSSLPLTGDMLAGLMAALLAICAAAACVLVACARQRALLNEGASAVRGRHRRASAHSSGRHAR